MRKVTFFSCSKDTIRNLKRDVVILETDPVFFSTPPREVGPSVESQRGKVHFFI